MPESLIHAWADHGETRPDTITPNYADAKQVMADLSRVGIDLEDVFDTLENEGVEKFAASWQELIDGVDKSLKAADSGASKPTDAAKGSVGSR
jgi:transaldolase